MPLKFFDNKHKLLLERKYVCRFSVCVFVVQFVHVMVTLSGQVVCAALHCAVQTRVEMRESFGSQRALERKL